MATEKSSLKDELDLDGLEEETTKHDETNKKSETAVSLKDQIPNALTIIESAGLHISAKHRATGKRILAKLEELKSIINLKDFD